MSNLVESNHSTNELAELNFSLIHSADLDKRKKVDSKNLPFFNQLLQFVPDAALVNEISTNQYMKVIANGALTQARDGNGQLGIVLGENGINSHARLFDPAQLKKLLTASVAMRVVTMAVGQAHLAEISSQLKKMNHNIAEIKQFLDDERASKVEAIDHYFDEYFLSANNSFELTSVRRTQVENDSREVDAVLLHISTEIKNAATAVKNYNDDSMFGSDKYFEALSSMLDSNTKLVAEWFNVAQVKAKAVQLLHVSKEDKLFRQRKDKFINQISELNKTEIADLRIAWINKIDALTAKLTSNAELAFKRNKLRLKLTNFLERINDLTVSLNLTMESIGDIEDQIEIFLEVKNNEVVAAYLPPSSEILVNQYKDNFLKNLGKKDSNFQLVPSSKGDDALEKPKKTAEEMNGSLAGALRPEIKFFVRTLSKFKK